MAFRKTAKAFMWFRAVVMTILFALLLGGVFSFIGFVIAGPAGTIVGRLIACATGIGIGLSQWEEKETK